MIFEQKWRARLLDEHGGGTYFPASVPGNVQKDYADSIGLTDWQFGANVRAFETVEDRTWEYCTELRYCSNPGEKVVFRALGIDYRYDVLLDGKKLLSGEGMYTPVELDITERARPGSLLQVILHPHPKRPGVARGTRAEASASCKPPVCYGWDWNPRLLISGFWLPAFVETRSPGYIYDCETAYSLDISSRSARVRFTFTCAKDAVIEITDPDGVSVYRGTEREILLQNIRLWWCNGQGEPALYHWTVDSGEDRKSGALGFRTVRLVMNPQPQRNFPKGPDDGPFTFELNGRRIFVKGSNFVNPEVFHANTTRAHNESLILAAKEAHMNILRIWGGAGLAKPEVYDLCDRHGILVWQEFPLACNHYPDDEAYLTVLAREGASIIKALRGHPCLALWCGGNELFNGWSGMTDQSLALRLLNKLCYDLDPHTPFLLTSPRSGMAHGGYTFTDGETGQEIYSVLQNADATAYSEFGVSGIASVEQLKKIIPAEELFPIRPTESWVIHHGFGAWGETAWTRLEELEHYFGKSDSLEQTVERSQWLMCEGYKAAFEEARRQWPRCSAALNWCLNAPWITAAGDALIAYPDQKTPAYDAVKESLKDALVSARVRKFSWQAGENLPIELWYLNDGDQSIQDNVTVWVEIEEERHELLRWDTGIVSARTGKLGPVANFTLPDVQGADRLRILLTTESGEADNRYCLQYLPKKQRKAVISQLNM